MITMNANASAVLERVPTRKIIDPAKRIQSIGFFLFNAKCKNTNIEVTIIGPATFLCQKRPRQFPTRVASDSLGGCTANENRGTEENATATTDASSVNVKK